MHLRFFSNGFTFELPCQSKYPQRRRTSPAIASVHLIGLGTTMTNNRKAQMISPGRHNEILKSVRKIMMRGWLNSLAKAKEKAANGDREAAKDVGALTLSIDMVIRRQSKAAHAASLAKHNKIVRLDDFRCDLTYVERKAVREIVAILDAAGGGFIEGE
jgi:hypothetical protein